MNQSILPAISNHRALEKFIETDLIYCVVMNFSVSQLTQVCKLLHNNNKKVIVHIDLIKGISSDEYGAEFLVDAFKVDGLISTHPSVIELSKKRRIISIQRIFIIDSMSLNKSIQIAQKCKPDFIEMLPGYSYEISERLSKVLNIPLIGGGLINEQSTVDKCLSSGLVAVTTSEVSLWK